MMKKVLLSPSSFGKISTVPIDILTQAGYEVVNNPFGRKLTEKEVIELANGCVGIVAGVELLSRYVMDALPNLKCISRVGVGMDNVDLEYANEKGIIVVNTPDGPTRAVAELTLGMILALLRRIPQADAAMKKRIWKKETGNLLFGKQVGIVGLGRIGRMVAELFHALGNPVIGYDPFPDKEWADYSGIVLSSLEEVLANADILTFHIPGNKDKSAVVTADLLKKVKEGAFLINLSRGGVVDEEALFETLKSEKLAGAAIDVYLSEPYTGKLCDLDNVVLTPHLGSYAKEGKLKMETDASLNLIKSLNM